MNPESRSLVSRAMSHPALSPEVRALAIDFLVGGLDRTQALKMISKPATPFVDDVVLEFILWPGQDHTISRIRRLVSKLP